MAMTAVEMIAFFAQQLERTRVGMAAAHSSSNYQLATLNCRQGFKCRLMQGLISWRLGTAPTEVLSKAVQEFAEDWSVLRSISGEAAQLSDTPAERVPFVAYLVDQHLPVPVDTDGLNADRLLDAVLGKWLFGSWDSSLWARGFEQLRRSGSRLALDTYELYNSVAHASLSNMPALVEIGEALFSKRKTDKFFSGGDQTEGGGHDNDVTVDYRLASLSKRAGYKGVGVHLWQW